MNQALNLLYYPEQKVNITRHTVVSIEKANQIIVPFRNPLDSIASYHIFPGAEKIEFDIKFYIRFYNAILSNLNKIILMDFDHFTKDIEYIKNKILKHFDIITSNQVTDDKIKESMLANGKEANLPRNNKAQLDSVKLQLKEMPEFNECLDLYNTIKYHHNL